MMEIIIKGNFTLEGDIPALDKLTKKFKYAVLESVDCPVKCPLLRLTEFSGIEELHKKKLSEEKK